MGLRGPRGCSRGTPLAGLHRKACCPRATVRPGYPDLPLEARTPSDVGGSASRRSTAPPRLVA